MQVNFSELNEMKVTLPLNIFKTGFFIPYVVKFFVWFF